MSVYTDADIDLDWRQSEPLLNNVRPGGAPFSKSDIKVLKQIHAYLYGVAIWPTRCASTLDCERVYLDSLTGISVNLLCQVALGSPRGASIFLRSMIEDALRYVYFKDHPIEFIRSNAADKWYVDFQELNQYIKSHPLLLQPAKKWDVCNHFTSQYAVLSEWVHARTVQHLPLNTTLSNLEFSQETAKFVLNSLSHIIPSIHLLIISLDQDLLNKLPESEYRIIRRHLPTEARKILAREL